MKHLIIIGLFLMPTLGFTQKTEDRKIILTVASTEDLYRKVKIALVKADFIVKDDGNTDTLTTYPTELGSLNGLSRLTAVISGNTVTLSGIYGLKSIDDWGYNRNPKEYKPIMYFKGSKAWRLLMAVAENIGWTEIAYSK